MTLRQVLPLGLWHAAPSTRNRPMVEFLSVPQLIATAIQFLRVACLVQNPITE